MALTYLNDESYYNILNLPKDCSQESIAEAYRHLALKYHPKRASPEEKALYEFYFQRIAEAYEILGDPIRKNIYDIYGKQGLRNGVIDAKGNEIESYSYQGNAHEIFENFMGASNPFTLIQEEHIEGDKLKEIYKEAHKNENSIPVNLLDNSLVDPIDVYLECTLEELYNGCTKAIKYKREILNADQMTTEKVDAEMDVEILPGYDKTTVLTFNNKGNESAGKMTSPLLVHIKEKKHSFFKRVNKNDLIYKHTLSLADALNSKPVKFTTLDGRKLSISMDVIISQNTVKKVTGEGMPIFTTIFNVRDTSLKKGDLFIMFNIIFPEHIDPIKKQEITDLLEAQDLADLDEEKRKEWKRNQVFRDKAAYEAKLLALEKEKLKEIEDKEIAEREKFKKMRSEI